MKTEAAGTPASQPGSGSQAPRTAAPAKIHPVVIYPIIQPHDYSDLTALYQLIARLDEEKDIYARPITVMDRKTYYGIAADQTFLAFRTNPVARYSDLIDAWCVDTCQMWYSGLGHAFEKGGPEDVYWLIPGDFNYGTAAGREVLSHLHHLPEIILELDQDLCVGEIAADQSHSKQLIDTYGTFALLYHWFPAEAQEIRQTTERPRSEFLAMHHRFLRQMLSQPWYAYEQTVAMLLRAVFRRQPISRFFVGDISDLPQGRDSLASAVQQVERTERVLKTIWREQNQSKTGWPDQYQALEMTSGQIRRTALTIFQNLLN